MALADFLEPQLVSQMKMGPQLPQPHLLLQERMVATPFPEAETEFLSLRRLVLSLALPAHSVHSALRLNHSALGGSRLVLVVHPLACLLEYKAH